MAIPIIDSLLLATDLPLDSRTVVITPYDGSRYFYAGFIGFESSGNLPFYVDNSLGIQYFGADSSAGVIKSYVDGSLAARDISINWLANYNIVQDASISAIEASLGDFVKKTGDLMSGPLQFGTGDASDNIGGAISSEDFGTLLIESSLGIGLKSPYLRLPDASAYAGSYMTIGEGGLVTFTTLNFEEARWNDTLPSDETILTTLETSILAITVSEDVSFGSVSWNIAADLPNGQSNVIIRAYRNSTEIGSEYYTGNDGEVEFNGSLPITQQGFANSDVVSLTIESSRNPYDVLEGSEITLIKTGNQVNTVWGSITGTLSDQTDLQLALDLKADKIYVDGSLASRDISINYLYNYNTIQDASILANTSSLAQLDASIVDINNYQFIQDASILVNTNSLSQLDASIVDINNYQIIQDASIANIEASLNNYVLKAGDTMTGDLIISGAGLQVAGDTSLGNLHVSGNEILLGDLTIGGDLTVDGSVTYINTEQVNVSDNFINLNTGLTGIPPATLQSGISIQRGDLEPYVFIFDEDTLSFRIGIAEDTSSGYLDASTQAVATREDNPQSQGVAYWNNTEDRFDTNSGFIFNPGESLALDTSLLLSSLAGSGDLMVVVGNDGFLRGEPIPDVSAAYTDLINYVDGSLLARDTSINFLTVYNTVQDSSIIAIEASLGDYVKKAGDTMTGNLIIETDLSVNGKGIFGQFNVSGTTFPGSPISGDKFYRTDLEVDFQYDSSRGKWVSTNRNTFSAGKSRSNAAATNYLLMGDAVMDSITGIHMWAPGVITKLSVQNNRAVAGTGRTLEIRVNNSTTYKETLTIEPGNMGAFKFVNLDVSTGDIIQILTVPGNSRIDDIIFNFEVAERA